MKNPCSSHLNFINFIIKESTALTFKDMSITLRRWCLSFWPCRPSEQHGDNLWAELGSTSWDWALGSGPTTSSPTHQD